MNKLPDYSDLLEVRERAIDHTPDDPAFLAGEDKWVWIKQDTGAWDGPAFDWNGGHREKVMKYLRKHDTVVTAGGNQGMYTRFYSYRFKTVYSFEPDPLNFHCLVVNNQADNVIKIQAALGSENKLVRINRNGYTNTGTWGVDQNTTEGAIIPQLTIDTLGLTDLDLLQLDVEGYEINAIKGAKKTIEKFRPVVILENGGGDDICAFMGNLGYERKDQTGADSIWVPKE
jgi:FkbM family methyltransferase